MYCTYKMYIYIRLNFLITGLHSNQPEIEERMRILVLFDFCVSAQCFLSGLIYVAVLYTCTLYCVTLGVCATDWTWRNGVVAALPLSNCRIHQPLSVIKDWKYKTEISSNLLNFIIPQNNQGISTCRVLCSNIKISENM